MLEPNSAVHIVELARGPLDTEYGEFQIHVVSDGLEQCMLAVYGDVRDKEGVRCRLHSECICSHVFFSLECDCSHQMRKAMRTISKAGKGVIVFLAHEGRANGAAAHIATQSLKRDGVLQDEAYVRAGFVADNRSYRIAAKALTHLGVRSVALLSSSASKRRGLEECGLPVSTMSASENELILLRHGARKRISPPYLPIQVSGGATKVLVIGDLMVDYTFSLTSEQSQILDVPPPQIGGTAFNAAKAFKNLEQTAPILFGRVGNDADGRFACDKIDELEVTALVGSNADKRTGACSLVYNSQTDLRILLKQEADNANDYNLDEIDLAVGISGLGPSDYAFLIGHFVPRCGVAHAGELLRRVRAATPARLVLDLVPHNMHEALAPGAGKALFETPPYAVISEEATALGLIDASAHAPGSPAALEALAKGIGAKWLVLRHGVGNINTEDVYQLEGGTYRLIASVDTGYASLTNEQRRGFGDLLTAKLFARHFLTDPV